jgi:hypothetical protein
MGVLADHDLTSLRGSADRDANRPFIEHALVKLKSQLPN